MINIANTNSSMLNPNQNRIGVLTDTEVLLVDVVQRKQVLRSNLLPVDADNLSGLLEHLWQLGLSEVWILPTTTLSQSATCALFEEINDSWVAVVHPNPSEPDRPICAIFLPRREWSAGSTSPYVRFPGTCRMGLGATRCEKPTSNRDLPGSNSGKASDRFT